MQSIGRTAFPYVAVALGGAAFWWAVSFGTLPPADYTFGNNTEIKTVDPALVTGHPEGRIIRCISEGLVNWHPETLQPIPGVAERWDISSDGRTYTFHLRDDALWSDGTRITADDFVWSFRRFLHPETASEYSYELWYVVGAKAYSTLRVRPGDAVEVELPEKPPGARPFASGIILRGRLQAIEDTAGNVLSEVRRASSADAEAEHDAAGDDAEETEDASQDDLPADRVYVVEVDGQTRRFRQGGGAGFEDYRWILRDFNTIGIRSLGERTLQLELNYPTPYFLQLMGFYPLFPVNRVCFETYGYPAWTKPGNIVTNGPFLLAERRIRDRIRMVKNPLYWNRDNVHFNVIDALSVQSEVTALNLYMTGEADYIPDVPATVVPELLRQQREDFQPTPYFGTYYYRLNTRRPPLDDPQVRRALNMAIDKVEIVEKVTRAGQIPARSLVPQSIRQYMNYTPAECDDYNPDEARRLLAEAGYPGGRGFPRIDILYNTHEAHRSIAELIQAQWKRTLGIDVSIQNQEWSVYLSEVRQGRYWVGRAAWIGDYLDPNTFLDMFVTGGANNQTGWGNPRYDELIESAKSELDPEKRLAYFREAETILMDELPVIPVYYYVTKHMIRPYVKGFYNNIQDVHPIQGMWIDEEERREVLLDSARSVSPGKPTGSRETLSDAKSKGSFSAPIGIEAEGVR